VANIPEGSKEQRDDMSYLLRLWRMGDGERPMWQASLKNFHNGQRVGLASLEDLFHILQSQCGTLLSADVACSIRRCQLTPWLHLLLSQVDQPRVQVPLQAQNL
jgi:hypothetical protein